MAPYAPFCSAVLLTVIISLASAADLAPPTVISASDPIAPGETALLFGEGFAPDCKVELARLADDPPGTPSAEAVQLPPDALACEALQASGLSVKLTIAPDLQPGVFVCRAGNAAGWSAPVVLNRPAAWWAQGDLGATASPGGWVRAQGKCLTMPGVPCKILLTGPATLALDAEGDGYSVRAAIPATAPQGEYELRVHNGRGGPPAWSAPQTFRLEAPRPAPARTLSVRDFGAAGDGRQDDTAAVKEALATLKPGDALVFPRGRYLVSESLTIPEGVTLKGESRELCLIAWPDREEPLADMLLGTHDFALEDLTFGLSNHGNFLTTDLGKPESGNVRLRRLRVLGNRFRGHMYQQPEEMSKRFTRFNVHGGKLLTLGGSNVEVTECDFLSSGCCLYLTRARNALIRGNRFRMGRFGWYWLSGSDGVIFEDNEVLGADLSTWGGGINTLDGSSASQNVYFARNRLAWFYGGDHEALTTDGSGSPFFGGFAEVSGKTATLDADATWGGRDWVGAGVFILGGRGVGQWRRLVSYTGRQIELDRPWDIPPDQTSRVSIAAQQRRLLFVGNDFEEVGMAIQLYGTSIECIAEGNRCRRGLGFINHGMNYYGNQPSWFCQWLRNEIAEGNSYGNAYVLNSPSAIEVTALRPSVEEPLLLNIGTIVRGNRLLNNAAIVIGAGNPPNPAARCPWLRDAIVEGNAIRDNEVGIAVADDTAGVLLRSNACENVARPVLNVADLRREMQERRDKLAGAREPIAHWSFDELKAGKLPDLSGHGLLAVPVGAFTREPGGVSGSAGRFDGSTYLTVGSQGSSLQDILNQQQFTLAVWVKPDDVDDRQPLIGKRFLETGVPFILSIYDGTIVFEGSNTAGRYEYNFSSPPVLKPGEWQHVAVVVEGGKGVTLYCDGVKVAEKAVTQPLCDNPEPLVFSRDPWAGPKATERHPVFYRGLMDEAKFWARALSAEEVAREGER